MTENNYNSSLAKLERRRRKRRKIIIKRIICFLLFLGVTVGAVFGGVKIYKLFTGDDGTSVKLEKIKAIEIPDWIDEQIIRLHNTARTGTELDGVKSIVIHYVGTVSYTHLTLPTKA